MNVVMIVWVIGICGAMGVLYASARWSRIERSGAEISAGLLLAALPFVFAAFQYTPWLILAAATHVWLLLLPARLLHGRLERPFILQSTRRDAGFGTLIISVVAIIGLWWPSAWDEPAAALVLAASVGTAFFFIGRLWWSARRYRAVTAGNRPPLDQVPTISVCVPARNEDHALAECLAHIVASDYPKLEVIVVDDCSQDATSSIIRSFAHDGVRFVPGEPPRTDWLGKNMAMQTLAEQASGDYILCVSVDTHVEPHSISTLVQYTLTNQLEMVSVLPQNRLPVTLSTILPTLEYFWRAVLPITSAHVPVSSKAWLIRAQSLDAMGGFAAVKHKIVPEEFFAARLAARNAYHFLISDSFLGVTTAKRWLSQIETSIRISYPRLHRQPLVVYLACLTLIGLAIGPYISIVASIITGYGGVAVWVAVAAAILWTAVCTHVLRRTQPKSWLVAAALWPLIVIQEAVMMMVSMLQYELGEVKWKGRNVCYPVVTRRPPRQSRNAKAL